MKHAVIIAAIIVGAFIVGCEDTNTTAPLMENPSSVGKAQRVDDTLPLSVTPLNAILREPRGFNDFTEVAGQVAYRVTIVPRDPAPPHPQYELSVTLAVDADLKPFGTTAPRWTISSFSLDELGLTDLSSSVVLEKHFRIDGRNDNMFLYVQFEISAQAVKVERMWLQARVVGIPVDYTD